ncbi:MAG: hypothetical protein CML16_14140 [Pusillimonas sp.]|nr:hypothetical protein [Pusillimonas sp.]MBC43461.1 hypothetical protein [Pusillimonas sp.]HCP78475.1 hypothetical protein [Pusillimonas sp.]|tara:strand:+ start:35912 stop:38158 length:2247 start_codon:yes stop_codon:yes gene_type:complete
MKKRHVLSGKYSKKRKEYLLEKYISTLRMVSQNAVTVIQSSVLSLNRQNLKKARNHLIRLNFRMVWHGFLYQTSLRAAKKLVSQKEIERFYRQDVDANTPLVSVIIPCFNYGNYVTNAIDSVLNQTLKKIEVIVVDGGSTDVTTRPLLQTLQRPRTQIILREGRHLVGSNRNFGIEKATGRYVCCLDADDTLDPTYLEKALFLLENYAYDCVSTAIRFTGAREGVFKIHPYPDLKIMMEGNHIMTCAVFRRELWSETGGYFDTGLGMEHVAEDWDFWIRIAAEGARLRNIVEEALFNYRVHEQGSLSSTNTRPLAEQRLKIHERNKHVLDKGRQRFSSSQAKRFLKCRTAGGALTASMLRSPNQSAPCVFIALPLLIMGGAERLLSTLTHHLAQSGWRMVIITTLPQSAEDGDAQPWFAKHTSEIYRLPAFLEPHEWNDYIHYLLDSRQPDCLLLAGSSYFYEHLESMRLHRPEMAVVDLLFNTIGHVDSHRRFRQYIDSVIAENEEVKSWFKSIGWHDQDIHLVESGIDTAYYEPRPTSQEWRAQLGIGADDYVIGFSGRMSDEKAPDIFVDIAHLCKGNAKLHFVMTGIGPLSKSIEKKVSQLSDTRIHFLGAVDNIEFIISQYDILLLPSRLDGRPQVVLEALAMGVPVIASNVGGLPSLVEPEITGYLCRAADAEQFSNCLQELAQDAGRFKLMKQAAREFALNKLGIERMVGQYKESIYYAIQKRKQTLIAEEATTKETTNAT